MEEASAQTARLSRPNQADSLTPQAIQPQVGITPTSEQSAIFRPTRVLTAALDPTLRSANPMSIAVQALSGVGCWSMELCPPAVLAGSAGRGQQFDLHSYQAVGGEGVDLVLP